jgi:hypothetical protein
MIAVVAFSAFKDISNFLGSSERRVSFDRFFFKSNIGILNLFNLGNQNVELEARHHLDGNSGLGLNSQEGAVLLRIRGETLHQFPIVGVSLQMNHGK